jgi:hypothetical protein
MNAHELGDLDRCVWAIGQMLDFAVPDTLIDEQATWANERKIVLTKGEVTATYEIEFNLKFNALIAAAGIVSNWVVQCT